MPTLKELGYDVEFSLWVGVFAPKGTPATVIAKVWRENIKKVATSDQFKTMITNIGDEVAYLDAAGFRQILGRGRQAGRSGGALDRPRAGITEPTLRTSENAARVTVR